MPSRKKVLFILEHALTGNHMLEVERNYVVTRQYLENQARNMNRLPIIFPWSSVCRLIITIITRRPASADRTARRQFQATGQPVSRTQASDAMTSRLPRYEGKCVQRRCFQCGSVPLRSDIKWMERPRANILIPLERQLIVLQLCCWQFLYNETLQVTFHPLLSKLSKRRQI